MRIILIAMCLFLSFPVMTFASMPEKEFKKAYREYKQMKYVYKYNKNLLNKLQKRIDAGEAGLEEKYKLEKENLQETIKKRMNLAGRLGISF